MSVSPRSDMHDGVELHQTIQPKAWWIAKFQQLGLEHLPSISIVILIRSTFAVQSMARLDSFHLILEPGPVKGTADSRGDFTTAS